MEYYYSGPAQLTTLPIWDPKEGGLAVFDENKLPNEVKTLKGDHKDAYLVLSYNQGYEEKIKLYFDTHFERIDSKNFSPGLNLYVYKMRYDAVGEY